MKKSYWKKRAVNIEQRARTATDDLKRQIAELTRELEDKRKNWAPIKIKHPYEPRDAGCKFCDDPRDDPRHA